MLASCVLVAVWAIYASAQSTNTNATVRAGSAPAVGALANRLADFEEKLGEHDPLFHLDRIALLRDYSAFGQPYWK